MIANLFALLESLVPFFLRFCPVRIGVECEGIVRDFLIFCDLFSEPGWEIEFFIDRVKLDICEDNPLIWSLIGIEFPDFSVGISVFISELAYLAMSYHNKESDAIRNLPFILITNIGFIFPTALFDLEGKCR